MILANLWGHQDSGALYVITKPWKKQTEWQADKTILPKGWVMFIFPSDVMFLEMFLNE